MARGKEALNERQRVVLERRGQGRDLETGPRSGELPRTPERVCWRRGVRGEEGQVLDPCS